jgi:hypothetical protein
LESTSAYPEGIKTATLVSGKDAVFCHLCQKEYAAERVDCVQSGCQGNVISIEEDYFGRCHTCGRSHSDGVPVERWIEVEKIATAGLQENWSVEEIKSAIYKSYMPPEFSMKVEGRYLRLEASGVSTSLPLPSGYSHEEQ